LIGGLLESSSLWFGLKALTIFAAILYIASAVFPNPDTAKEAESPGWVLPKVAS